MAKRGTFTVKGTSVARRQREIQDAIARGELIEAYDLVERAISEFPEHLEFRHAAVLTLARTGAVARARQRFSALGLDAQIAHGLDSPLKIEIATLNARLAKDAALIGGKPDSTLHLKEAASIYEKIFLVTRTPYPGINAATLSLLSGRNAKARSLAQQVQKLCARVRPKNPRDEYFNRATEAEAALVLGDLAAARDALEQAAGVGFNDWTAKGQTRHQLKLVCAAQGIDASILSPLAPPSVIHFTGHVPGEKFPRSQERRVRESIKALLVRFNVGFGFGSLAAGADIVFAEALIEHGAELDVLIPFEKTEFLRVSVAPFGNKWLERFETCFKRAKRITFATADSYLGHSSIFAYCDRIAMGLAILRAKYLDTEVTQFAVWDQLGYSSSIEEAGTFSSMERWRRCGQPQQVIDSRDGAHSASPRIATSRVAKKTADSGTRSIRAMLFCDIKGFGQLREEQLPAFLREVLGRYATVLARYRDQILYRNTWGDGLYVVTNDVDGAANCALDLLDAMETLTPEGYGLPAQLAMRVGGHFGPVFKLRDPVLERLNYVGSHVSRAAMIEPVTPEGAAYVTEAFAAALATSPNSGFDCEYMGQFPAAKRFGTMRMYSLRRSSSRPSPGAGRAKSQFEAPRYDYTFGRKSSRDGA